ncbi:MAG: DUF948 domain-containing protein [Clostridia bacterium]|nr:DUF948 domain-containing protein [Clostridia bacterium]
MNTIITFTLKDLLLSGVYLALIIMLIYIIKFLIKANQSLKNINKVVEENRIQIDQILKEAPGIATHVNTISEEVAHDLQQFRGTIDNISETSEEVTGVIKENKSVVGGLTSIFHTASIAKGAYNKFFTKDEEDPRENDVPRHSEENND